MSKVVNLSDVARQSPEDRALKSGGGDGTFDGMEARVTRLEQDMNEVKLDLKALRADTSDIKIKLSEISGKLSGMPSTWQIVGICAGLIALVIASSGGLVTILRYISTATP